MPTSTCFLVAPASSVDAVKQVVVANAACFEVVVTHTAAQAQHALRAVENLSLAVIDADVVDALQLLAEVTHRFPGAPVVVIADTNVERFSAASSVIPHNFPHALAVALRRETAKVRAHRIS